ncbi:prefoldin subunit alpha [Candidatus Woesearchaeota archaeon]|nr:prefoldin subunit alpha [Candidatus Woesearchaeota archaeon]
MQFQRLQQQLEKISEHVELLHQQEAELDISQNAIEELSKTPLHNEVLVPIANGIFFKAEVKENSTLIVHVGSDTTVEHTVEDVLELLEKQQKEIKSRTAEAEAIVGQMQDQMSLIYKEIAEAEGSERDA